MTSMNQNKRGLFRPSERETDDFCYRFLTIYSVHEHDFNRPGCGMLTVRTAIFHWLYFD